VHYRHQFSPRKELLSVLLVSIDSNDTCGMLSSADYYSRVVVEKLEQTNFVFKNMLPSEHESGTAKFHLQGETGSGYIRLMMRIWIPGAAYAIRWFRVSLPVSDMIAMEFESRKILSSKRMKSVKRQYHTPVLNSEGDLVISYQHETWFNNGKIDRQAIDVHEVVFTLEHADTLFNIIAYKGHKIVISLNKQYIGRANKIIDERMEQHSDRGEKEVVYTEYRLGKSDPVRRKYIWVTRDTGNPIRSGFIIDEPLLKIEARNDKKQICDNFRRSLSEYKIQRRFGASYLNKSDLGVTYTPDSADFSNREHVLPVMFFEQTVNLKVVIFNMSVFPPSKMTASFTWSELLQNLSFKESAQSDDKKYCSIMIRESGMGTHDNDNSSRSGLRQDVRTHGLCNRTITEDIDLTIGYTLKMGSTSRYLQIMRIQLSCEDYERSLKYPFHRKDHFLTGKRRMK